MLGDMEQRKHIYGVAFAKHGVPLQVTTAYVLI